MPRLVLGLLDENVLTHRIEFALFCQIGQITHPHPPAMSRGKPAASAVHQPHLLVLSLA
jgi:hypothetical protein